MWLLLPKGHLHQSLLVSRRGRACWRDHLRAAALRRLRDKTGSRLIAGWEDQAPAISRHLRLSAKAMAGRAGGALKTGRFNKLGQPTPMSNFFLTMVDLHGVPVERHGESTGQLSLG
jgi:hypothetical protein